jgi:hypothetical protein
MTSMSASYLLVNENGDGMAAAEAGQQPDIRTRQVFAMTQTWYG